MVNSSDVIERLLTECECVTVPVITQALGIDFSSAVQAALEFAGGKDNIAVVYSVCYADDSKNIVLSHKTDSEIERLRSTYGDIQTTLLGLHKGPATTGFEVTQMSWKYEIESVGRELKQASDTGCLYIPKCANLVTSNIRIRKYEQHKQGDSALCTPVQRAAPASAALSNHRLKVTHEQPKTQSQLGSVNGKNERGHKRAKVDGLGGAVDPNDGRVAENSEKHTPPKIKSTRDKSTVVHPTAGKEDKPVSTTDSQEGGKPAVKVVQEAPVTTQSEDPEDASLFECDDPCDAMDLDTSSCNDQQISYVEKVTRENTYVDSGYFVVEESDEYVQVTGSVKSGSPAASKHKGSTPSSDGKNITLLKKPKNNLNQVTLMSFFKR